MLVARLASAGWAIFFSGVGVGWRFWWLLRGVKVEICGGWSGVCDLLGDEIFGV